MLEIRKSFQEQFINYILAKLKFFEINNYNSNCRLFKHNGVTALSFVEILIDKNDINVNNIQVVIKYRNNSDVFKRQCNVNIGDSNFNCRLSYYLHFNDINDILQMTFVEFETLVFKQFELECNKSYILKVFNK